MPSLYCNGLQDTFLGHFPSINIKITLLIPRIRKVTQVKCSNNCWNVCRLNFETFNSHIVYRSRSSRYIMVVMINKLHPAGHGYYLNQKRDIFVKNVIFFPGNVSQLNLVLLLNLEKQLKTHQAFPLRNQGTRLIHLVGDQSRGRSNSTEPISCNPCISLVFHNLIRLATWWIPRPYTTDGGTYLLCAWLIIL